MTRLAGSGLIAIVLTLASLAQQAKSAGEGSVALPDKPRPHGDSNSQPSPSCSTLGLRDRRKEAMAYELRASVRLTSEVSSRLPDGAQFRAELDDPIQSDGRLLLPKGTVFHGHVESARARRPLRSGALRLIFDRLLLPDGTSLPAHVSLEDLSSPALRADQEGRVRPTLSKKRLLLQLGGTALVAKLADDAVEEAAAVSAGSARWVGLAGGATFLLLQKGREVRLQPGDKLEVVFSQEGLFRWPAERQCQRELFR